MFDIAETPEPTSAPTTGDFLLAQLLDLLQQLANPPLLIAQDDVPAFLVYRGNMSKSAFFALKAADAFPRPVSLPAGRTMYRRKDLEKWVDGLKHARGASS